MLLKAGIIGHAPIKNQLDMTHVYDYSSLPGPDIGSLSPVDRMIWVKAISVFGQGDWIIWPANAAELFAMQDYKGTFESNISLRTLAYQPPAKMLRSFAFTIGESLVSPKASHVREKKLPPVVKVDYVPAVPLEKEAAIRMKVAHTDEAEVDTSHWV